MGGDEFCVLLKDGAQEAACAREFLRRLAQMRQELPLLPMVSFGSAPFTGEDIAVVKEQADQQMYRYKKAHRDGAAPSSQ